MSLSTVFLVERIQINTQFHGITPNRPTTLESPFSNFTALIVGTDCFSGTDSLHVSVSHLLANELKLNIMSLLH